MGQEFFAKTGLNYKILTWQNQILSWREIGVTELLLDIAAEGLDGGVPVYLGLQMTLRSQSWGLASALTHKVPMSSALQPDVWKPSELWS